LLAASAASLDTDWSAADEDAAAGVGAVAAV